MTYSAQSAVRHMYTYVPSICYCPRYTFLSDLSVHAQSLGIIVINCNYSPNKEFCTYILSIVGVWLLSGKMPHSQSREPGFESPKVAGLLLFRKLGIFVLSTMPQFTSCANEYLAIDSGGNVSE